MHFLKIVPLKFWLIGVVVLVLVGGAYQTFIGDQISGSPETSSTPAPFTTPYPSESPSPETSPVPASSVKTTPRPSLKASSSPVVSVAPTTTPAASSGTTSTSNSNSSDMRVSEVNPTSGNFMQTITLKGNNFGNSAGSVAFYGTLSSPSGGGPIESWSNTEIKVKVPAIRGNTDYQLEVSAGGKTSNRIGFKVISGQPQLNSVSPNPAPGVSIILSGSELGSSNGAVTFFEGNTPAGTCSIASWSDSQISCTVPANLTQGKEYGLQVTTSDGRQTSFKFYTLGS